MIDKDLSGVLFPNHKTNERQPDFWGHCSISGVTYKISAWKRKSKTNDMPYLSVAFQVEQKKTETPKQNKKVVEQVSKAVGGNTDFENVFDDEPLPF